MSTIRPQSPDSRDLVRRYMDKYPLPPPSPPPPLLEQPAIKIHLAQGKRVLEIYSLVRLTYPQSQALQLLLKDQRPQVNVKDIYDWLYARVIPWPFSHDGTDIDMLRVNRNLGDMALRTKPRHMQLNDGKSYPPRPGDDIRHTVLMFLDRQCLETETIIMAVANEHLMYSEVRKTIRMRWPPREYAPPPTTLPPADDILFRYWAMKRRNITEEDVVLCARTDLFGNGLARIRVDIRLWKTTWIALNNRLKTPADIQGSEVPWIWHPDFDLASFVRQERRTMQAAEDERWQAVLKAYQIEQEELRRKRQKAEEERKRLEEERKQEEDDREEEEGEGEGDGSEKEAVDGEGDDREEAEEIVGNNESNDDDEDGQGGMDQGEGVDDDEDMSSVEDEDDEHADDEQADDGPEDEEEQDSGSVSEKSDTHVLTDAEIMYDALAGDITDGNVADDEMDVDDSSTS